MQAADTANLTNSGGVKDQSGMMRAMVRGLVAVGCGAFLTLLVTLPMSLQYGTEHSWSALLLSGVLRTLAALMATGALFYVLRKLEPVLDANALAQAHFLDTLDSRYVDGAITLSAALSLFLELALIRWQSSVLAFLAFYKNFSLLACFAGLGLGYALAARSRIPLVLAVPLLAAQFCFILLVRIAPNTLAMNPFRE
jgi:hypothetical protein